LVTVLGLAYWEIRSPWLGDVLTLNTGVYDSICLLAGFYKPIVVDAQRGQVVVDGLGTVTPDVTHIGNVFQHVGPVELTWALAKCLLAPPKILRDVLAVN
jgi:hypothetical protein